MAKGSVVSKVMIISLVVLIVTAIAIAVYILTKDKDTDPETNIQTVSGGKNEQASKEEEKKKEQEQEKKDEASEKAYCDGKTITELSKVEAIEAFDLKATSSKLKWVHPNAEQGVDIYTIEATSKSDWKSVFKNNTKKDNFEVTNLLPDNRYEITIKASRCGFTSKASPHEIITKIAPPSKLSSSSRGKHFFRVKWEEYDEYLDHNDEFQMNITALPENKLIVSRKTTQNEYYASALKVKHLYKVSVRVFYDGKMSDSVSLKIRTEGCGAGEVEDDCKRFAAQKEEACKSDSIYNTCPCFCKDHKKHIAIDP